MYVLLELVRLVDLLKNDGIDFVIVLIIVLEELWVVVFDFNL